MKFKFQPGDVILIKADENFFRDNRLFRPFFKGFRHIMFYYGKTSRGAPLGIETSFRGALISNLEKQINQKVEVYRIDHQYSKIFAEAVIKAGEKIVNEKVILFDYLGSTLKGILSKLGLPLKMRSKYYPFYICPEFIQICFENAVDYLEGDLRQIYQTEILSHFPASIMLPADFAKIPVLKKVWQGKIKSPIQGFLCLNYNKTQLAPYTEISSNIFRRRRRRGESPVICGSPAGLAAFFDNFKFLASETR